MDDFDFLSFIKDCDSLSAVDYQYFYQLLHNRTIIFNREVDSDIIETIYLPLRDFEKDDSEKPVTLILNSIGGSVSDGFFLASYLTKYKKKLNILVTGYAASMATVILAAGGKNDNITRMCYPSTYGLIHDGYVALSASESKTAEDIMSFNKKVDQDIRQFIIDNTNITPEQFDSKARQQWFLSAEEMKEFGLIDEIL
jgi:ATP-dependent Clp protease protease subunit